MNQLPAVLIFRFRIFLILGLAVFLAWSGDLLAVPQATSPAAGQFVIFDAPGAGTQFFQGTTPTYIDGHGEILGWIQDANNVFHGFLRTVDGEFTIFDVPAAGTDQYQGTFAPGLTPNGFNNRGDVAGQYLDANNTPHSFIRGDDGSIITFDPPESVAGSFADGNNNRGIVVGGVNGANFLYHAFIRSETGSFELFDAPDAGTGGTAAQSQGTLCTAINNENDVVGIYADSNNQQHGFLRDKAGHVTEFQAPGAAGKILAYPYSINNRGEISGLYSDANGSNHGFLRKRDGELIAIDVEGAGTGEGLGTVAEVINDAGEIVGFYTDVNGLLRGFVRKADGSIITFDAPGAGTSPGQGTFPAGINEKGDVAGSFTDANDVVHGFLLERHE